MSGDTPVKPEYDKEEKNRSMTVMIKQGLLRVNILAMTMKKMPWKGNKEKSPKGAFLIRLKLNIGLNAIFPQGLNDFRQPKAFGIADGSVRSTYFQRFFNQFFNFFRRFSL